VLSPQHKSATDRYDMTVMYQDADDYKAFVAQTYAEETRIIEELKLREMLK